MTAEEVAGARDQAVANGDAVFELAPKDNTRQSLFDAVRTSLPLDPPVEGSRSWDALSDSIFGGLHLVDARTILITWADASKFRDAAPAEFVVVSGILDDVANLLANWEATYGEPKRVAVALA